MGRLKVGDKVLWRGCFGANASQVAVIDSMELCDRSHMKSGVCVDSIDIKDKNRTVFDLTNGSWAYGTQISPYI